MCDVPSLEAASAGCVTGFGVCTSLIGANGQDMFAASATPTPHTPLVLHSWGWRSTGPPVYRSMEIGGSVRAQFKRFAVEKKLCTSGLIAGRFAMVGPYGGPTMVGNRQSLCKNERYDIYVWYGRGIVCVFRR